MILDLISRQLALTTHEIEKQQNDKKALTSAYTSALKQLERKQRKLASMISVGSWTEEDLWEVGLSDPPVEKYARGETMDVTPLLESAAG